jgi:hypothetical protein
MDWEQIERDKIDPNRFRTDPEYRRQVKEATKRLIKQQRLSFDLAAEIGARVYRSHERPKDYELDEEKFRAAVATAERIYRSDLKM